MLRARMLWSILGGLAVLAFGYWTLALWRMITSVMARAPLDPDALAPSPAPRVSIVVPARNEEDNIERCLSSLLAQRYPDFEVIVVDDRSTDRTYEIAARLAEAAPAGRCTVVRGEELEPGWMGKSWANHQGQKRATGVWLLFTDADTSHAPGCLPAAMRAAIERNADLQTLLPHLECRSFWEKVLQPIAIGAILSAMPLDRAEDPKVKMAVANGQYLLFKRAAYDAIGGHEAIKGRVTDDVSLGLNIKTAGLTLRFALATKVLSTRMYTSLRALWWGYVKNMREGADLLRVPWIAQALVPIVIWTLPPALLALAPFAPRWVGLAAVAATAAMVAWGSLANRLVFQIGPWWTLTNPLGGLMLAGMSIHSHYRAASGRGPLWKGRAYPTVR